MGMSLDLSLYSHRCVTLRDQRQRAHCAVALVAEDGLGAGIDGRNWKLVHQTSVLAHHRHRRLLCAHCMHC